MFFFGKALAFLCESTIVSFERCAYELYINDTLNIISLRCISVYFRLFHVVHEELFKIQNAYAPKMHICNAIRNVLFTIYGRNNKKKRKKMKHSHTHTEKRARRADVQTVID